MEIKLVDVDRNFVVVDIHPDMTRDNIWIEKKKNQGEKITSRVVSIVSLDCSYLFRKEDFVLRKLFESVGSVS
jgi:hypothetical protein